jgi:hypothetical protein
VIGLTFIRPYTGPLLHKQLLDHPRCEFLLVGAREDAAEELGREKHELVSDGKAGPLCVARLARAQVLGS